MDSDTLRRCHEAGAAALSDLPLSPLQRSHVSAHVLMPYGFGVRRLDLPARFSKALAELGGAHLGEPVPELTDEQRERAALVAARAVEAVLSHAAPVEDESNSPVGANGDGDDCVQRVVDGVAGHDEEGVSR